MQSITVKWNGIRYTADRPNWDGGRVYMADEVDTEIQKLRKRILNLKNGTKGIPAFKSNSPLCPTCGYRIEHGYCFDCDRYCGCSFDPESLNDYCDKHRPNFSNS